MCVSSVIYDAFGKLPDSWYTLGRIDLFKTMISDAKLFDRESNQADCEDPDKTKILERIENLENKLEK